MTYKYFTEQEFVCHETGENEIVPEFIHRLDELRELESPDEVFYTEEEQEKIENEKQKKISKL